MPSSGCGRQMEQIFEATANIFAIDMNPMYIHIGPFLAALLLLRFWEQLA